MFNNFYLSVLWSLLVNAVSNTSSNSARKYWEKMWNLFKGNSEDTRGMSMFLNASMSMRLFWWIQLYLNLCQHLSFQNLFHLVHCKVQNQVNMTRSTKLWVAQHSPEFAFRIIDFCVPKFSCPDLVLGIVYLFITLSWQTIWQVARILLKFLDNISCLSHLHLEGVDWWRGLLLNFSPNQMGISLLLSCSEGPQLFAASNKVCMQ